MAGVQHQVEVVAHQAAGQHLGIEALQGLRQHGQMRDPVSVVAVDRLAAIAARSHVVDRARKLDAQRAGHDGMLLQGEANSKT